MVKMTGNGAKQRVYVAADSSLAYTSPNGLDEASGQPSDFNFSLSWPVSGSSGQVLYLELTWDITFSVCSEKPHQGPYQIYATRWGQGMRDDLFCPDHSPPQVRLGTPARFVPSADYSISGPLREALDSSGQSADS